MLRRMLPLLALPLAACAGSVETDALDDGFGAVWSSVRLHGTETDSESIVLTNVMGACGKLQTYNELYVAFMEEVEDMDAEDYCSDAMEPALALAKAGDSLYYEGAKYLSVYPLDGEEWNDDGYDIPEDAGGGITEYTDSSYAGWADDWDEDGDWEDGCGIDSQDAWDIYNVFAMEKGEVNIDSAENESRASGDLEADLLEVDLETYETDDAGEVTATFSAVYCEIEEYEYPE